MATVKYKLRYKQRDSSSIYLRFTHGRAIDVTLKLPIVVKPEDWSDKKQEIVSKDVALIYERELYYKKANHKLLNFKHKILASLFQDEMEGVLVNAKWVRQFTSNYFGTFDKSISTDAQYYFGSYMQTYIDKSTASDSTKKTYSSHLKRFENFETFKSNRYRIRDINEEFRDDFVIWASDRYAGTSTKKSLKIFKQVIKKASRKNGVDPSYQDLTDIDLDETVIKVWLTQKQRNQVRDLRSDDINENARRLFLIGLHTGARISDLMKIAEQPIVKDGVLTFITVKTGIECKVEVHPDIKDILFDVHPISDQNFNIYIKTIAKELKWFELTNGGKRQEKTNRVIKGVYPLHELVTSKICRRSYISIRYWDLKHNIGQIRVASGHGSDSMVLTYVGDEKKTR